MPRFTTRVPEEKVERMKAAMMRAPQNEADPSMNCFNLAGSCCSIAAMKAALRSWQISLSSLTARLVVSTNRVSPPLSPRRNCRLVKSESRLASSTPETIRGRRWALGKNLSAKGSWTSIACSSRWGISSSRMKVPQCISPFTSSLSTANFPVGMRNSRHSGRKIPRSNFRCDGLMMTIVPTSRAPAACQAWAAMDPEYSKLPCGLMMQRQCPGADAVPATRDATRASSSPGSEG